MDIKVLVSVTPLRGKFPLTIEQIDGDGDRGGVKGMSMGETHPFFPTTLLIEMYPT